MREKLVVTKNWVCVLCGAVCGSAFIHGFLLGGEKSSDRVEMKLPVAK